MTKLELPPVWLAAFAALAWASGRILPLALPYGAVIGWGLILAGALMAVTAAAQMVLGRTTFIPRRDPAAMVTEGVFALTRNPIYLGDALVLAGVCLVSDALAALVLVPLFIRIITRRFILDEEDRLRRRFGVEFDRYAARVRRWL